MSLKSYFTRYCWTIIAFLLIAIAGCGGGDSSGSSPSGGTEPVCGNGQCEAGETCSSCPQDCTSGCDPTSTCTDPVFITSDTNGGWSDGGYYVHNNMWNSSGYPVSETLYACAYNNWYVVADANDDSGDGAVKTYPNVHKDYADVPIDSFAALTSTFAAGSPHVGIYNVAYDIWLNGVAVDGCTELMIWTENFNQVPAGSMAATVTLGGRTYDVWREPGSRQYVAFVPGAAMTSGTLDIKEMLDWMSAQGWISANATLGQICFGVEIVSTGGVDVTFTVTDFSIDSSPIAGIACQGAPNTPGGDDPWGGCWPGSHNTGYPHGLPGDTRTPVMLTPYTGPCDIHDDNVVIDAKEINCNGMLIYGSNVVIKNSMVHGPVNTNSPTASLTLQDSAVDGMDDPSQAVGTDNVTVIRADIYGNHHSVHCESNCSVTDAWLHDQYDGSAFGWHQNGFLTNGGTNHLIRHNTVQCNGGCTADIALIPDGDIDHVTVDRNLLVASPDASFCLYPSSNHPNKTGIVQQISVTDNIFQRGSNAKCAYYGPVYGWDTPNSNPGTDGYQNTWSGNLWDDGGELNP